MIKFKKIKGLEAKIFALLLLFLPVNLAKHFFFDFAYVDGILVDYLLPTVYLTDILIWALLGFWVFRELQKTSSKTLSTSNISRSDKSLGVYTPKLCLLVFVTILGFSVFKALNQPAAVYRWLKLVEYVLFSFYVSKHINLKKDWPTIVRLLSLGVLLESVLAIAQWFKQGSIFGYWFLGENKYTVSTPGIAAFDLFGVKKVRPYGTFPHPNVLGGYLAILLPWIFYELKKRFTIRDLRFTAFVLGATALLLSFSRSAWAVGVLGLLGVFGLMFRGEIFLHYSLLPSAYCLSFLRRAELNWIALEMFKDHPLLGVGLNNFTVRMSEYGEVSGWTRFLQPAHNVYLLIAAETGLLGLAAFLCFLFFVFCSLLKKKNGLLLISVAQITLLCFVDHYFFTLPQTALLFWLLIGLVFSN